MRQELILQGDSGRPDDAWRVSTGGNGRRRIHHPEHPPPEIRLMGNLLRQQKVNGIAGSDVRHDVPDDRGPRADDGPQRPGNLRGVSREVGHDKILFGPLVDDVPSRRDIAHHPVLGELLRGLCLGGQPGSVRPLCDIPVVKAGEERADIRRCRAPERDVPAAQSAEHLRGHADPVLRARHLPAEGPVQRHRCRVERADQIAELEGTPASAVRRCVPTPRPLASGATTTPATPPMDIGRPPQNCW